jgi:hypothetical protein
MHKEGFNKIDLPLSPVSAKRKPSRVEETGRKEMDAHQSIINMQRELGDELFMELVNPDNSEAVREFAMTLAKSTVSMRMVIADRTYDILSFMKGEDNVNGDEMVSRAVEMGARLGLDDGQYILEHQYDIPAAYREKVIFVFPECRHPEISGTVLCIYWNKARWARRWDGLVDKWNDDYRLLRRQKKI